MLSIIAQLLRAARKLHAIHHSHHKHVMVGHHLERLRDDAAGIEPCALR